MSLRSHDLFTFLPTFLLTSSPDNGSPAYEWPGFPCISVDSTFLIPPPLVLQPAAPAQRAIFYILLQLTSTLNLTWHRMSSYSSCSLSIPTNLFESLHTRSLPSLLCTTIFNCPGTELYTFDRHSFADPIIWLPLNSLSVRQHNASRPETISSLACFRWKNKARSVGILCAMVSVSLYPTSIPGLRDLELS